MKDYNAQRENNQGIEDELIAEAKRQEGKICLEDKFNSDILTNLHSRKIIPRKKLKML